MANNKKNPLKIFWTLLIFVLLLAVVAGLFWFWLKPSQLSSPDVAAAAYKVSRGDLVVRVTESGNIKALNAADIKSEVEGQTTIISIVEEGTIITPEDVAGGKVLVELDSSEIKERLTQQEITFASAEASFTEAKESYEIQIKQNESDIKAAELKVKFARMDLEKYLGETVVARLIDAYQQNHAVQIDIASLLQDPNQLGGGAKQSIRELEADIGLKQAELIQAEERLTWTKKLNEKEYVSKDELKSDELTVERRKIDLEKSLTSRQLFQQYDFAKQTEKLFSDYLESLREMERREAEARSRLAQAEARLKSNQATYQLQKERLEKLQKQLAACIIRAPSPGMVVYESDSNPFGGSRTLIEPGATIRERQKIMSLPNTAEMGLEVKVHETWMAQVRPGQFARITVDAFPNQQFTGKVLKIAMVPDQQNFFLNPDLKVYATELSIDGRHDFLKTGMSAKVEIIVQELPDVIYVPVQAVANRDGKKWCFLAEGKEVKPREVKAGAFNENFIQIIEGLEPGQVISLAPPELAETPAADSGKKMPEKGPAPAEAAPSSGPMPQGQPPAGQTPPPSPAGPPPAPK